MANFLENFIVKHLKPYFMEESPGLAYENGARPPSIRRLESALKTYRFADLLPFEVFDEEHDLFINSDSYGFMLEISTAVGLDEKDLATLAELFNEGIDEDVVIQYSLYASPDVMPMLTRWANNYVSDEPEIDFEDTDMGVDDEAADERDKARRNHNIFRTLARFRVKHLLDGCWQSISPETSMMTRDFRAFITYQRPLPKGGTEGLTAAHKQLMASHRSAMESTIKTAGLNSKVFDADSFVDLLDTMINAKTVKRDRASYNPYELIKDQVVAKDNLLLVGRDDLYMNNPDRSTDISIFGVQNYPQEWAGWANGELIGSLFEYSRRISCPFLITMTVNYLDQLDQKSKATMKLARATSMSEAPIAKTVTSWHDKRREWEFVNRKIDEGHTNVKVNYQIVLFSTTEQKMVNERELVSTFKANKWELYKQRFVLLPAFMLSLPMGASQAYVKFGRDKKMFRTMPSFTAVNIAPWIAEWKGTPNPLQILHGDRGQLAYFNPWDNLQGNYNCAVAARPGAGKSFFMQEFILNVLGQGGRAWIFDRGRSFEPICHLFSDYYSTLFLVFDGSEQISLNPFTHVHNWDGGQDVGSERVMILNLLIQMAIRGDQELGAERQTWLDIALSEVWETKGRDAEITDVFNVLKQNEDPRYHDLADAIFPFTRDGIHGQYFTGPSTIDLSHDFVVLEMRELDDRPQLQTIVLLILMMQISQTMYSPMRSSRKQVCLIDEAWKLLSHGNAAQFIEEGYRTARKYNGAFVSISQGMNDFYKNATTRACLESSDWTVLLAQKEESIKQLANSDRLPGGKSGIKLIRKLKTLKGLFSEAAIIGPNGLVTVRLITDLFTEMLFSTNPNDVAERQELMARGLSLAEAIAEMVRRRTQPDLEGHHHEH